MNSLTISIADGYIKLLSIDESGNVFQKESRFDFDFGNNPSVKIIEEAARNLSEIIDQTDGIEKNGELSTGILIGTDQTFLSVFPVDFDDEKANIDSHILWELSNYFPSTYKKFNIRYYRLNSYSSGPVDDILIVAIERSKIETLKLLCDYANVRIRNIEVDHFTVEKYLMKKHPNEISANKLMIIGCRKHRLDFSVMERGALRIYDFDMLDQLTYENSVINQINYAQSVVGSLDSVYVYGDANSERVRSFLQGLFPEIRILDESPDNSKFSPLHGLAMKNL